MVLKFRLHLALLLLMLLRGLRAGSGVLPRAPHATDVSIPNGLPAEMSNPGSNVGSSPSRTRAARSRGRRRRSPRSRTRSTRARRPSNSTCTRPRIGTSSSVTTRPSIARRITTARSRTSRLSELREMDNAYWWIAGDTVTPGRAPRRVRRARPRARGPATTASSRSKRSCDELPRGLAEPGHQADRPRRRAVRGAAGRTNCAVSSDSHSVIVASFHDVADPAVSLDRAERRDVGRDRRGRDVLLLDARGRARACRRCARSRCPRSTATSPWSTNDSSRPRTPRTSRCTCGPINDVDEMDRLLDYGRGRPHQRPTDAARSTS